MEATSRDGDVYEPYGLKVEGVCFQVFVSEGTLQT